jgi:hypothetical protein
MQKGTVCIWPVAGLCPPCSLPSHTACTCAMDKKMYLSLLECFLQMLYYFLGLAPWQCMWGGKTVHTMQHHIQRPVFYFSKLHLRHQVPHRRSIGAVSLCSFCKAISPGAAIHNSLSVYGFTSFGHKHCYLNNFYSCS